MSVINSEQLGRSIQKLEKFFSCNGMWPRNFRLDAESFETYKEARSDWCVVIYEYREMRKQLNEHRRAVNGLTTMWLDAIREERIARQESHQVKLRCRKRLIPIVRRLVR